MDTENNYEDDPVIAQQALLLEQKAKKKAKCPPKGQKFDSANFERQKQLGHQDPQ